MTCQSLISDLSDVESPSVAPARMHLLHFVLCAIPYPRPPVGSSGCGSGGARRRTLCVHGTLKKWVLYVTFFE